MCEGGSTSRAAVIMATRNRCDTLRTAIRAAQAQTIPLDIIVMDDGGTDGTPAMMELEFPSVRYERSASSVGPCVLRNRASHLTAAPVLFLLDDDAVLVSSHTVEQTLRDFSDDQSIGAVAIPVINVKQSARISFRAPDDDGIYVTAEYLGASRAVRSDVYRELGGERESLFYMGEENDFCTRMLDAGYVVRMGRSDPIEHLESPARASAKVHFYGQRNTILYTWYNVPMPEFLPHLLITTFKGMIAAARVGWIGQNIRGTFNGYATMIKDWSARRPVRRKTYRAYRRLRRGQLTTLRAVLEAMA